MSAPDEGVVRFRLDFTRTAALDPGKIGRLAGVRDGLHRAGLIGVCAGGAFDGIGFGNASLRAPDGTFVISGTGTGGFARTDGRHYARVLEVDTAANRCRAEGPVRPSSEAMTHAAVYEADPAAGCVLHVHHTGHWHRLLGVVPTTGEGVPYGTPAMAGEVYRLFREEGLGKAGFFAMAGHEDGLVAFGSGPESALERLRAYGMLDG